MTKRSWILVAIMAIAALFVTLIVIGLQRVAFNRVYASNGERIYFTATNDRGERITYSGVSHHGGMMMGGQQGCVSCHGQNASGGVFSMMMDDDVMEAPDIRWSSLAGEGEGGHEHGEHAEIHAEYNLDTFRLAVVEGKHPNGDRLSNDMPRWNMDDKDLADLATFLKSPSLFEEGERFSGNLVLSNWRIIFPIMGIILMIAFMVLMFNRSTTSSFWNRTRREYVERRRPKTALEILKVRYAKGEITKEQFDEMKNNLQIGD